MLMSDKSFAHHKNIFTQKKNNLKKTKIKKTKKLMLMVFNCAMICRFRFSDNNKKMAQNY